MPDWHLHSLPHQSCHVPVYARASNGVCLHFKVVVSSTSFTTTCNRCTLKKGESPLPSQGINCCSHGQWAGVSVASLVLSQLPAWVVAPVTSNCSKPLQSSSVPSFKDRYNPIFSTLCGRMWTIFQLLIFFIVRRPSLLKFLLKVLRWFPVKNALHRHITYLHYINITFNCIRLGNKVANFLSEN